MKTKFLNIFRSLFKIPTLERWLRDKVFLKDVNSFWARLVPNNYQYSVGSVRAFKYNGVQLELDISDYVAHYLYFGFKDGGHKELMKLVKTGDTILDVGTNYGTTILQFAKLAGSEGKCYGFEPDPYNFKICQNNLKLNDFRNIFVENFGVGKESEELYLVVDTATNRGGNRISNNISGKESYKVPIVRIDDWIASQSISKIDLVKIDVEGFEYNALLGGIETWKKYRPTFFIELDDNNLKLQNASAAQLVSFLENLNYTVQHAETKDVVSNSSNFINCHFDIICVSMI